MTGAAYTVRPVGVVRSSLRDPAEAPRQAFRGAPPARLEIDPGYAAALHRVQPGDELLLLTWLHLARRDVLQVHPMGDQSIPLTGVFATRSPDRPNPIGLHRVRVLAVEPPATIHLQALEAIDGTPVLDLKVVMDASPEA
jgi:tRNA-Thr(GGU) m(6)t(6)A37 methyltransferase TsaA